MQFRRVPRLTRVVLPEYRMGAILSRTKWPARPLIQLFRGVVVQVGSEPSLDFCNAHAFALVIVIDLIAVDFPQAEVSGFRMCKVESADA